MPREPAGRRKQSAPTRGSSRRRRPSKTGLPNGGMAERLGSGLQIHVQRFNSASHLHYKTRGNPRKTGVFKFLGLFAVYRLFPLFSAINCFHRPPIVHRPRIVTPESLPMPPRLGGTPRPTTSSAHAAKMVSLHDAPTGRLLFQSVRLTGKAAFQAAAKVGA